MTAVLPLADVRVLSLAEQYPGPLCTRLLAELGARVIQIERPDTGDPARRANPWLFRTTAMHRESVVLNLKDPLAVVAARKLADRSSILIEGYRPGVMDRLGLGYRAIAESNPGIVYCSMSGFGQDGPYVEQVGHNINYEAVAGLLDPYLGERGLDAYFHGGLPVGDVLSGALAATALVAALREAEKSGSGRYLDLAITDSLLFAVAPNVTRALNDIEPWSEREVGYGTFATRDGHVALGIAYEDPFWTSLCAILNLPHLSQLGHAERLAAKADIAPVLAAKLIERRTSDWMELFEARVPCSPVNSLIAVADDPQLQHREMFTEALDENGHSFTTVLSPLSRGNLSPLRPRKVEQLGHSTAAVLAEIGLSKAQIAALVAVDS